VTVREELQRIAEVILDGTASGADRERLAALLADSPSAREVWADLEAAHGALARAGLDTPPPDLHEAILRGVAAEGARPRAAAPAWLQAIQQSIAMRPAARLAWGLAAGLAVVVVGIAALTGQFGTARKLGPSTVATLSPSGESDAGTPPGQGDAPSSPGPHVEARATRDAGGVSVYVSAQGAGGSDVSVTWNGDVARLGGFRWTRGNGDAPSLEPGRVLTHVSGDAAFEFTLSPLASADPGLQLRLRSGDREEVRKIVITAR